MDYTLSTLRLVIDPTCWPVGFSQSDQNNLINKAREAFYFTPEFEGGGNSLWRGIIAKKTVPVVRQFTDGCGRTSQTITLPRELFTLVEAADCNGPIDVRNEWAQFGKAGYWGGRIVGDLGDGFCGASDINPAGALITVTTASNETSGLTLVLTGTDINGYSIGETISLPQTAGSTATSSNTYYSISEVQKSATMGYLVVNQVTTGAVTLFAKYEPGETYPNYRRYQLGFVESYPNLTVKGKRVYYPLVNDSDPVEFGSVLAFETAIKAYGWFQNFDMDAYRAGLAEAIGYLNAIEAAYQAETANTVVQTEEAFSGGSIYNIL